MDLTGRPGVVTDGSSEVDFTTTDTLAEAGATVYTVSRTGQPRDAEKNHEGVIHVAANVSGYGEMENLIKEIGENKGIDFLINSTGITVKCRVENFDDSDFKRIVKVDASSIFKLSYLCYPYLKRSAGRDEIVNITSMATHLGFSEVVPYCTSKGAVLSMTRGPAVEWSGDNININSIAPGWFPSKTSRQVMDAEREAKILSGMSVRKFRDTRGITEMAEYLVSDSVGCITGQNFAVDDEALAFGF